MSSLKQTFFEEPDAKSDITLIVDDRKLHLNKTVLSYASPVFDRMFHGDFEEKTKSEISLPGKDYEKFVKFLLCVHPATLAEITKQNIDDVLPFADEYQVEQIKENCASFLQRQLVQCCDKTKVNNNDLIHYLMLADNFGLKQPLETCLDIAALRRYSNLEKIEDFKQISDATKVSLLSRRLSLIESPAMLMHKDMTQLKCTLSSAGGYLSCVEKRVYDAVLRCSTTVHAKYGNIGICKECALSICKHPLIDNLKAIHDDRIYSTQLEEAFETD